MPAARLDGLAPLPRSRAQDELGLMHLRWHERDASAVPPPGAELDAVIAPEPELDIVVVQGESTWGMVRRPAARVQGSRRKALARPAAACAPRRRPPASAAQPRAAARARAALQIDRPGTRVFELKFPDEPQRNLFFWCAL